MKFVSTTNNHDENEKKKLDELNQNGNTMFYEILILITSWETHHIHSITIETLLNLSANLQQTCT